jgi:hypothetical protein
VNVQDTGTLATEPECTGFGVLNMCVHFIDPHLISCSANVESCNDLETKGFDS